MKRVWFMTAVIVIGGCLGGCVSGLKRDSNFGVELTSGIKFYQSAPDEGSEAHINLLPEVWERIKKEEQSNEGETSDDEGDGE